MKALGVLLVVVGLIGLIYGGLTWTHKDTVLDAGPVEITKNERERIPIPPLAGGLLFVAGIALLIRGSGK